MSDLMFAKRSLASSRIVLVSAGTVLLVAFIVVWSASEQRAFLLIALALTAPLPLVIRGFRGQFDPFEPIALLAIAFTVLFVIRPAAHLAFDEMRYSRFSLERGFDGALLVALVGILAVYAGYCMRLGKVLARAIRPPPREIRAEPATAFALVLVGFGILLFVLFVRQVGGLDVAKQLFLGRDPLEGRVRSTSSVYFLFGPFLAIPATLLLLEAAAVRRRALFVVILALLCAAWVMLIAGPRGDRLWLLLLCLSVFVLPYLRRQTRPRLRTICVFGVLAFAVGITFLADVRVPIAREAPPYELFKRSLANPFRGAEDFILGADTEMFSVLALEFERVPSLQQHEPGLTLRSLATNWIPRGVYPGKPPTTDEKVYAMLFPEQAAITKAGTAPSLFGGFYYDSGFYGVIVGSLLFGIITRSLYEYLKRYPSYAGARLVFAAALPFVVITARGNPTDSLGRMAYIVFPILMALAWSGKRTLDKPSAAPGATGPAEQA